MTRAPEGVTPDPESWVPRIRAGDPAGLEGLVARFEAPFLRLAAGMLADPGDAADAVQETFVSAWRRIAGYRDGSDLEAWLVTLCLNHCRGILRSRSRQRRVLKALPPPPDAAGSPPGPLENAETRRLLREGIAGLPEREREAFLLIAVEGHPSPQAAGMMGCTPEAARQALSRARRTLADRLRGV